MDDVGQAVAARARPVERAEGPDDVADVGHLPANDVAAYPQLHFLFVNPFTDDMAPTFNPVTRRGWRGPYLVDNGSRYRVQPTDGFMTMYGQAGDYAVTDAWGRPLVVQQDANTSAWYLVSAGQDGNLLTTHDNLSVFLR